MLEKFINKDNLTPEQLDLAYSKIKEYCDEKNQNVIEFISNKANIPLAATEIQKKLPFAMRMVVKPKHLEEAINNNLDFIIKVATERYNAENTVASVSKNKKTV